MYLTYISKLTQYIELCLYGTIRDYKNTFLITGISSERIVN